MAVKVDKNISSFLSLKPIYSLKSKPASEVKIFEMIFHFIPFLLCANFHNRCEASQSSLLMKCKVAEQGLSPGLVSLSRLKWAKEDQQGLCDRQGRSTTLRLKNTQRGKTKDTITSENRIANHLIKLKFLSQYLDKRILQSDLHCCVSFHSQLSVPFFLALEPNLPVKTHRRRY